MPGKAAAARQLGSRLYHGVNLPSAFRDSRIGWELLLSSEGQPSCSWWPMMARQLSSFSGHHGSLKSPPLTADTISSNVRECEYAVRGDIVTRAQVLERQLALKPGSLPFDEIISCNIGNPQSLGQKPITFFREVLSLCEHPALLSSPATRGFFSSEASDRASAILSRIPHAATGAYSHSQGLAVCREAVAAGIERRDGHPCSPDDIFLTDGASPAVQMLLRMLIRDKKDGVLCPIPQYPLYSATLTLLGGSLVPYYLEEEAGWRLNADELRKRLARAHIEGIVPRALVVINPGNPTGQVLSEGNQRDVLQFCAEEGLLLLADEVYQENVYADGKSFSSFKKVARDMGLKDDDISIVSVHSASKGFYGECGRRGGYMEITGVHSDVRDEIYKLASVNLCSNVVGQILMATIMTPPAEGTDAFPLFSSERQAILSSLARRAQVIVDSLNELEGVSCNQSDGAMYAFPSLHLPRGAAAAAEAAGMKLDSFYARRLLDSTGIVTVPGSGFGQVPGTWHLRFTILPQEDKIGDMMLRIHEFHKRFMDEFRG